jgi:hypothetical protein
LAWGRKGFHKYNATRTSHAGFSFASKGEAALYDLLKLRECAGEIRNIKVQDHVYLTDARIHYIPDFKFVDTKKEIEVWAEYKGFETPEWRIKRRLWQWYGPGPLEVWKGNYKRPMLSEVIIQK